MPISRSTSRPPTGESAHEARRAPPLRRPGSGRPPARPARRQRHTGPGRRIHIEKINAPFLFTLKGRGSEFGAGLRYAVDQGWLMLHESGTYVKLLAPGEDLLAK
ncbi:hypothetical protein [Bradyrhizobium tunisiense]|uniref:hypothetical protein n=1 Tax=Bradyrhizobium tunisiense TaxID=3278709 RepID=UPI0035E1273F